MRCSAFSHVVLLRLLTPTITQIVRCRSDEAAERCAQGVADIQRSERTSTARAAAADAFAGDCILTFNDVLHIMTIADLFKVGSTAGTGTGTACCERARLTPAQDNYGPKQACISFMAVGG